MQHKKASGKCQKHQHCKRDGKQKKRQVSAKGMGKFEKTGKIRENKRPRKHRFPEKRSESVKWLIRTEIAWKNHWGHKKFAGEQNSTGQGLKGTHPPGRQGRRKKDHDIRKRRNLPTLGPEKKIERRLKPGVYFSFGERTKGGRLGGAGMRRQFS